MFLPLRRCVNFIWKDTFYGIKLLFLYHLRIWLKSRLRTAIISCKKVYEAELGCNLGIPERIKRYEVFLVFFNTKLPKDN